MSNQKVDSTPNNFELEIEKLKNEIKTLREQQKSEKVKKEHIGVLVEFTTSKGQHIKGLGRKYYVVNLNGKLYYKQEENVKVLG